MKTYYAPTVIGMAVALAAVAAAAILANSAAAEANARYSQQANVASARLNARAAHRQSLMDLEQVIEPARRFSSEWHKVAKLPGKQPAEVIRTDLETIAQRQLGLITDGAITPQTERYSFGGSSMPVQRVTLRAIGKDLAGLLTWLGAVEERYPLAVLEHCEFSSSVGGNTGLTIRLTQPLQEPASIRSATSRRVEDIRAQPAVIAATQWSDYTPLRMKAAVAVGFERNPLQPAISPDPTRVLSRGRSPGALAAKLDSAIAGRLHSVVRGPVPIINIDGKMFRVGDEIVIGAGREKPVIDGHTRLKEIDRQQLVFHVSGGTFENPIECDIAFSLPMFFQPR